MYHERQRWSFCGVHAVNNLLQQAKYDKASFDQVCETLAQDASKYWNPHRSPLGIGNYDANVLCVILEQHEGYTVQWHDARKEMTQQTLDDYFGDATAATSTKCGIVVNLPSTSLWGRLTKGRHWIALLWFPDKGEWYNLNSDLKEPTVVGDMEACATLLQAWGQDNKDNCHIILARKLKK